MFTAEMPEISGVQAAKEEYRIIINYNKSEKEAQELYDMLRQNHVS